MKFMIYGFSALLITFGFLKAEARTLPHIDPEATGNEYRHQLEGDFKNDFKIESLLSPRPLQSILNAGARNLDWLQQINSHREHPISFSSKANAAGFPITAPKKYNPELITQAWAKLTQTMPAAMAAVIVGGAAMTDNPPLSDDEYAQWGLEVDRIYQNAARWTMMEPYLNELTDNRFNDVRGYYFLSQDADRDYELSHWAQIPSTRQSELQEWLVGLCLTFTHNERQCISELNNAITRQTLPGFYQRYLSHNVDLYASYFQIPVTRSDVRWSATNPDTLDFPFVDPQQSAVSQFLKLNIEDEWRWQSWRLLLNFKPQGSALAHIEFQPGSTPHVNGVAGDIITMDANAPLSEYDVQWTIRHEFGHVLGFVDCYVEFFEPNNHWIVNYQLDTNNLMCSRQGRLQATHFNELKRAYFR